MQMKKSISFWAVIMLVAVSACNMGNSNNPGNQNPPGVDTFNLVYVNGLPIGTMGGGQKLYTVWAETVTHDFIQNFYVCTNCLGMPNREMTSYWYKFIRPKVDAVTSATHKNSSDSKDINFTLSNLSLSDPAIRSFYICFEIDRSWDYNEWFTSASGQDQPAVLYRVLVDLDAATSSFVLAPVGWTAGPMNNIASLNYIPGFALGVLNTELRYLTHHRNSDNSIGSLNTDAGEYSALDMVGSITVNVNK
jgi:hypothetical protein